MKRFSGGFGVIVLAVMLALFLGPERGAQAANGSYIDLDQFSSSKQFSSGSKDRVVVHKGTVRLGDNPRTARDRSGMYNGGRYFYGTLTSRVYNPSTRFDTVVPSWNASTPSGTWIQTQIRVRSGGSWTTWFNMGVWAKSSKPVKRHSVNGQNTAKWRVLTDTLQSKGRVFANAYQYRLKLMSAKSSRSPAVRKLSFVSSNSYRHGDSLNIPTLKSAWGKSLNVPARSQMIYPNGGEVWCSPTSLSMVMAYWANKTGNGKLNQPVPTVAHGVYDQAYRGNGNWPFNTAYASAYGLEATVSRFASIRQAERWTDYGIPLVVSIAWDNRHSSSRLSGVPIPVSNGHLLVIRGFTNSGDVRVNDPAASSNSQVPRVYDRSQFFRAWMKNGSGGVVYLVYPPNKTIPPPYASHGSW